MEKYNYAYFPNLDVLYFQVYLEWLDQFVCMLHREPHASGLQRNFLQEEWRFVQATCPHVTEGDSLAATRFW